MKYSQLKHKFLFCRQDLSAHNPFNLFIVLLQTVCPTWHISQHTFVSNKLGNYVSCCRSCLYLSPHSLISPLLFSTLSDPNFLKPMCSLSHIFNPLPSSLFVTKNKFPLPSSLPTTTTTSSNEPKYLAFVRDDICWSISFYPRTKPSFF